MNMPSPNPYIRETFGQASAILEIVRCSSPPLPCSYSSPSASPHVSFCHASSNANKLEVYKRESEVIYVKGKTSLQYSFDTRNRVSNAGDGCEDSRNGREKGNETHFCAVLERTLESCKEEVLPTMRRGMCTSSTPRG